MPLVKLGMIEPGGAAPRLSAAAPATPASSTRSARRPRPSTA